MIIRIPAIRHPAVVGVFIRERVDAARAVVFEPGCAFFAVGSQAGAVLGADAHAVAGLDGLGDFGADADGFAYDFVADADGYSQPMLASLAPNSKKV